LILPVLRLRQEDRQRELDACLQKNLDNPFIARVYLLTEETVDLSHLRQSDKIAQTVIGERLTYEEHSILPMLMRGGALPDPG